jgi:hypothetical protein
MMYEYYKMGRTCAVTMEIVESASFLRERHANLLQELDDREKLFDTHSMPSTLGVMSSDLTVLTTVDVRIRNLCQRAIFNWHC